MARKPRKRAQSGVYYILAASADKLLFIDDEDRKRFAGILVSRAARDMTGLWAYCTEDEKIHLVIKEGLDGVSTFVRDVLGSYAVWFNLKYRADGRLFSDRFRSLPLEEPSEGVFRKAGKAVYSHLQTKAAGISSGCKPNAALTERKKIAGVFAFVAVPLPMTGVWTGSAVACIAGLNYRKALFAVTAGNFVASLIVTLLTFFFKDYVNYIIAGFCACALAAAAVTASKLLRKPKKNI